MAKRLNANQVFAKLERASKPRRYSSSVLALCHHHFAQDWDSQDYEVTWSNLMAKRNWRTIQDCYYELVDAA